MFVVLLKFSENKSKASEFMSGHNAWIKKGFDDGVFLMVGSVNPNLGGAVVAHGLSREEIESRVEDDPFVAENVVRAEIIEISPSRASKELEFLMN
jgi:uncharacterized protein YciI